MVPAMWEILADDELEERRMRGIHFLPNAITTGAMFFGFYAIMCAIQSGAGLGALPEFMAQNDNDLVRILPDIDGPRIDAYFVYPEELRASKRIAVFRDFLLRKVAESRF